MRTFHQGLYTLLAIPNGLKRCEYELHFGFAKNPKEHDSIMVVVIQFSKMGHFILCHKSDNASHSTHL